MSMLPIKPKNYNDGRTKQSFKDSTDINKLLKKAQVRDALSHIEKWGGQYGDLSGFDFQNAQNQLAKAKTIFAELPSEVRAEFGQNPANFFEFANKPGNMNRLAQLIPGIAEPGRTPLPIKRTAENIAQVEPRGAQEAQTPPNQGETPQPPETPPQGPPE